MSFNIAHAYVIEALDTHPCQVSEYVHEYHDMKNTVADDDICHLHHFFHIAFILPEINQELSHKSFAQKPYSNTKTYEYNSYDNFLKPPINS
jgi:hypothetical protein